jgi:broad specificity phosphatase PhoE
LHATSAAAILGASQPLAMSQLTLIRHGQAAAFSPDSDRLTELGRRQAEKLGEYLVARGVRFDGVHSGTLRRHLETEQIVGQVYRDAGLGWPQASRQQGWNEYDAEAIIAQLGALLAERDGDYARLVDEFASRADAPDRNRYFQRMFEALMEQWVRGDVSAEGVEQFVAFHDRVRLARAAILGGPGGRSVAVFTSGGPIGVCVQLALEAPPHVAVKLNWRVKNGSFTEFSFSSGGRLSLDSFNAVPHLDAAELLSFR